MPTQLPPHLIEEPVEPSLILASSRAVLLRRYLGRWQHVRGIPRMLWLFRPWVFPSGKVLVFTPAGLPITIDPNDYGQLMLFYFAYCPELQALLADALAPGDVCLDLGANVGVLTAAMAELTKPNGRVVAVEPNREVGEQLLATANRFFPNQVQIVFGGIAGAPGSGWLLQRSGAFSESAEILTSANAINNAEPVNLTTIDLILESLNLKRTPDFIKVDIEGAEMELLESMGSLIAKGTRPILLVEFHPEKCLQRAGNVEVIRKSLHDLGYGERHVVREGTSYRLKDDVMSPLGHENVLFVTPSHLSLHPTLLNRWNEN